MSYSICVVIVLYNPSIEQLLKTISSIKCDSPCKIILIDNSELALTQPDILLEVEYIWLMKNYGIAYAQNLGLKKAMSYGFKFAILSDQDTIYPHGYGKDMVDVFNSLTNSSSVIALAPSFYDIDRDILRPFVKRFAFLRFPIKHNNELQMTFDVIASGLFINLSKINEVGFMNEDLFIDWVDFEWCWRVHKKQLVIYGVKSIKIKHCLGYGTVSFGKKKYPIHSPIRFYYIVRNGIYLAFNNKNISLFWRLNVLFNTLRYSLGYFIFGRPFKETFRAIISGFFDGVLGNLGQKK